jgi:hypothetical protein
MGPRPPEPGGSGRGDLWWCHSCPSRKAHTSGPLIESACGGAGSIRGPAAIRGLVSMLPKKQEGS